MSDKIVIKGTSDGLTISIGSGHWENILTELGEELSQKAAFFKGGRVLLSVGNRLLDAPQIEAVGDLLSTQQMSLWAIHSQAEETRSTAIALGLESGTPSVKQEQITTKEPNPEPLDQDTETTMTIRHTIRSGQIIEHPGHIVIIGDVNPGAKIVAGGHVIVWGKLRGTVFAGAINPADAFVCALALSPMQLIIGNIISRAPAEDSNDDVIPEIAFVQDGSIVAEAWP
ncbi:MAG: septum site-determining protein MinC [Chloroflexota bacterium]